MELIHSGKVRDVYKDGADLILVASDRISVYDVILPTPIPDKGALLTQLSLWWFDQLAGVVPNHIVSSTDVPEQFAARAVRVKPLKMASVECIVRGYLTGSGLAEYNATGSVCGIALPPGLVDGSQLPEPIFTPTTKAPVGGHDEAITFEQVVEAEGEETAHALRNLSLKLYAHAAPLAAERGIILADSKFEFGFDPDGVLTLGDEVFTSDSSRYWPAESYAPGGAQPSFDKQYVRDWATDSGWNKQPPAPEIPDSVVHATRDRYIQAYEQLTGHTWA